MRLNKFLAECGVGSRRGADALIAAGKVSVNGRKASVGVNVDPQTDRVTLEGRPLSLPQSAHTLLAFNKPRGIVTTMRDERGRKTVADCLPKHARRLFPVGRLDAETTGLLLLTSDGALARFLMHPSSEIARRYEVVTHGDLTDDAIRRLDARDVRRLTESSHSFSLVLREGKNRQVRRMCAACGLRVTALRRTQFGPVRLGALKPGRSRAVSKAEMDVLERMRRTQSSGKRLERHQRKHATLSGAALVT